MATGILVGVMVLMGVSALLFLPTLELISARYLLVNTQTRALEANGSIAKSVDVMSLSKAVKTIKEKLDAPIPPSPLAYIAIMRSDQTAGITFTGYGIADATQPIVELHGVAATREALQQFVDALHHDSAVASVDSPVENFVKSTQSQFVITVTFAAS